jgi:hypothetical protein
MKSRVYIETTIPSYLTAPPSRDLIKAAHQQITGEWWAIRDRFDLYISQIVIKEAGGGDPDAAAKRLNAIEGIPILQVTEQVDALARQLVERGPIPEKAAVDALHIAVAVANGLDYLLTWNCTHIANAAIRDKIDLVCRDNGFIPPIICTPIELMEI